MKKSIKSDFNYFSPIKGVLGIKTNLSKVSFTYGELIPRSTEKIFVESQIRIEFIVLKDIEIPKKTDSHYFNSFSGKKDNGIIYFERKLFNKKLKLIIQDLETNRIKVIANKNYFRFVYLRLMNLHSLNYILSDIVTLKLLQNGFAPLYCSSFSLENMGYTVFAPPKTGKTRTLITIAQLEKDSFKYLGEDIALTNGVEIFPVPYTNSFRSKKGSRLKQKLLEDIFKIKKEDNDRNIIYNKKTQEPVKSRGVFFLDRGIELIKISNKEEAFQKINILNSYLFKFDTPVILVYAYFNTSLSIDSVRIIKDKIVKQFLENTHNITSISSLDYSNFSRYLIQSIKK